LQSWSIVSPQISAAGPTSPVQEPQTGDPSLKAMQACVPGMQMPRPRERHRVAGAGANDVFVDHAVAVVVDAVAGLVDRGTSRHVAGDHAFRAGVETVTSASADALATRRRRGNDARIGSADHAGIADAVAVLVLEVAALLECGNDLADASAEDASGADARAGSAFADASRAGSTRVAALDVAVDRAIAVVVHVVAGLGCREAGGGGADELHSRAAVRAHAHAGADAGAARITDTGVGAAGDAEEKTAVAVLVDLVVGDLGHGTDGSDAVAPGHRSRVVVSRAVATDADAGVAGAEREARLRDVVVDHAVAVVVEAVGHAALGAASGFVGQWPSSTLASEAIAHPDAARRRRTPRPAVQDTAPTTSGSVLQAVLMPPSPGAPAS
jgi:hypothetical protein